MKKLFFILICTLLCMESMAQIKSFSAAKPIVKENEKKITYDSTRNFVGKDVEELLGQELYVIPKREDRHKIGYFGFYSSYENTDNDVTYIGTYELFAGKTFIVDSIFPRRASSGGYSGKQYARDFYPVLKLREKDGEAVYYYLYAWEAFKSFPFIIMGFYEKEKNRCVGKQLVIKKNKNPWESNQKEDKVPLYDVITGLEVQIDPNDVWTIKELTVDQYHGVLAYMITNKKDETLTINLTDINDYHRLTGPSVLWYDDNLKNIHEKQPEMYKRIMDCKVAIGMTRDMVLMAWGYPSNVNDASFGDGWLYSTGDFLFFVDGKLKSFQ